MEEVAQQEMNAPSGDKLREQMMKTRVAETESDTKIWHTDCTTLVKTYTKF